MNCKPFFCLLIACSFLQAGAQTGPTMLDSFMQRYTSLKNFNGSVLVAHKGKILLDKGYGSSNVAAGKPTNPKDLYQYGSITKQFTAALILKLEEAGKLRLEDKLSLYYPQLSFADSVTLHHLLTHTSGIFNYTNDPAFMSKEAVKPTTSKRIFELFEHKPLAFVPGSQFSYSNSNYMLLGYIAEKVGGKPYEVLARQYLLQPAGMKTAGFDFVHQPAEARATGYNAINGKQAFAAGIVDSSVSYAAGALYGSVYDLYAWHRAMQEQKLLSPESWKKMYQPLKDHYALGVVSDSLYGQPRITHGGGIFGFVSDFNRFPQEDLVVIVLSNNGSMPLEPVSKGLAGLVLQKEVSWPVEKKEIKLPVAVLETYTGQYELRPDFIITISVEDGRLMGQPTGQPKSELFAETEQDFFLKVVDASIRFQKEDNGKVNGLLLLQGGREMKAKKIK